MLEPSPILVAIREHLARLEGRAPNRSGLAKLYLLIAAVPAAWERRGRGRNDKRPVSRRPGRLSHAAQAVFRQGRHLAEPTLPA
jgi:hypothetical protein